MDGSVALATEDFQISHKIFGNHTPDGGGRHSKAVMFLASDLPGNLLRSKRSSNHRNFFGNNFRNCHQLRVAIRQDAHCRPQQRRRDRSRNLPGRTRPDSRLHERGKRFKYVRHANESKQGTWDRSSWMLA